MLNRLRLFGTLLFVLFVLPVRGGVAAMPAVCGGLALTVIDRDGNSVAAGLIDSDLMHVTATGVAQPVVYRYKLIEQMVEPISAEWDAQPWQPFHEDMYFYRKPDTQWLQLEVEDSGGAVLCAEVALQGGVLTAPPDDPIDPAAWTNMIERGFDVTFSEFNQRINAYNEQGMVDFKKAGIDHFRLRTSLPATEDDLFWHMDRSVDHTLRHGLVPIIAFHSHVYGEHNTPENRAAQVAWWTTVADRYATRSHKLSFNLFIEILRVDEINEWPVLNDWYVGITDGIRTVAPTHNIIYASIKISDPCELPKSRCAAFCGEQLPGGVAQLGGGAWFERWQRMGRL